MSNHSESSYRLTGDEQPNTEEVQPQTTTPNVGLTGPLPVEDVEDPPGPMPTAATTLPHGSPLHGSAERLQPVENGPAKGMRYRVSMQIMNSISSKFSGTESENVDEWLHQLEFLVKPHELTSAELAYILVNSVKGRAFAVLTEGDSSNYEGLKQMLVNEFRVPGAYMKAIQGFCAGRQGKNQKVSGYYHFLSRKMGRINEMSKKKNGQQLINEDLAIAVFLQGLSNFKVKERLASLEFKTVKEAYESACVYESVLGDSGLKRVSEEPQSDRPRKKFNKGTPSKPPQTQRFQQGPKPTPSTGGTSRDLSKVQCYKCQKFGHYAKECRSAKVGAVTLLDDEMTLVKSNKSSTVFARVGKAAMPVVIDSGADVNCISLQCLEDAGIKEMHRVVAPKVSFAGNSEGTPLGMATVPVQFHKDMEPVKVKFLVMKELVPGCLLGIDGQDQLKVRLDREQDLLWIEGIPITLHQSQQEALYQLGAVSLEDSFGEKLAKIDDSKRTMDYFKADHGDDQMIHHAAMSFEVPSGSYKSVEIEPSLDPSLRKEIEDFLKQHNNMFGYFDTKVKVPKATVTTTVTHQIVTDGSIVSARPYRLSPAHKDVVQVELDKMLKLGVIRRSKSNYASPVVLVPKPDSTWRFCVDYRKLNTHTKSDKYPLPNIDECLSRMKGAKYFAKLDLSSGYWQIPMAKEDIEKTAFVTPMGLYEFLVMPFGLKTAPATFQRMMDRLFGDLDNVMIYLDDVLVYSDNIQDMLQTLEQVFNRLQAANLKLKASKCHIGMSKINYLGFVVTEQGIEADADKVEAIRSMKAPTNVREVRRFLGMTSYYRNFIYKFAKIADPMTALTGKRQRFHWNQECQEAFDKLKAILCDAPVLAHPDFSKTFAIFTDASDTGVGAVLTQDGKPIWFASRVLTSAERKYDTREKECIGIMFGLDKFKPYFYGRAVIVFSDHGNLRWLMSHEQKGRLARWQLYLQQYDFSISYVKGANNPVADCLSRYEEKINIGSIRLRMTAVEVERKVKLPIKNWVKQQEKDPSLRQIKAKPYKPYVIHKGIVYRHKEDQSKKRLVIPEHLIPLFIKEAHNSLDAAHGGASKTSYHLRGYWFPSFHKRISDYCKKCKICLQAKGFTDRNNELSTREPLDILERVYIDVVGPLPNDMETYADDARYILTMMDDGSRFLCVAPLRTCKREDVTEAFRAHWISVFGAPKVIISDNHQQFKGEFLDMCKTHEILKEWTAPYSPEMNAVERVHKTLMDKVRALKYVTKKPWTECLPSACFAYNVAVHDTTGYAPYTLMFAKNRDIVTKLCLDVPQIQEVRQNARTHAFQRRKERVDKVNSNRKDEEIRIGDMVYLRNMSSSKLEARIYETEMLVKAIESKNVLRLETENGQVIRRARKDVKKV
jgi:hypothetical protein